MTSEEKLTEEDVKQMLSARTQARIAACAKELEEVLARHNCTMQPIFEIRQGSVNGRIDILPLT